MGNTTVTGVPRQRGGVVDYDEFVIYKQAWKSGSQKPWWNLDEFALSRNVFSISNRSMCGWRCAPKSVMLNILNGKVVYFNFVGKTSGSQLEGLGNQPTTWAELCGKPRILIVWLSRSGCFSAYLIYDMRGLLRSKNDRSPKADGFRSYEWREYKHVVKKGHWLASSIFHVGLARLDSFNIQAGWWFGTIFIFPYIGDVIIPIDENS